MSSPPARVTGEEDDEGSGSGTGELVYQGETTALTQLWFDDYGEWDPGVFNIDVYIASSGVDLPSDSGTGKVVYLEMFFDTSSVSPGTYSWSIDESAGTFSDFSDVSTVTDTTETFDEFTSGTVTIAKDGSNYTISGSGTTDTGDSVKFSYEGPLTGEL